MKKLLLPVVVLLLVCLLAFPASAAYDYTMDFEIYGTYDYAQAHDVLKTVNQARTAQGLAPLTMDATLTELAMQRAMETSVYWSHTRPDDSDYTAIFEGYPAYSAVAESIAAGQETAAEVTEYWSTSIDDPAKLMNPAYAGVGIGCFYQDGAKFWVLLFHSTVVDASPVPTEAVERTDIPIRVHSDHMDFRCEQLYDCYVQVYANNTYQPTFYLRNLGYNDKQGITISGDYTLRSTDESVVTCSGNTVTGISKGYADLHVKFGSRYFVFPFWCKGQFLLTADGYTLHINQFNSKFDFYWYHCYYIREGTDESKSMLWTRMNFDGFTDYSLEATMRYLALMEGEGIYTFVFRAYDERFGWIEVSNRVSVPTPGYKETLMGDVDGSESVDYFDAMLVMQYFAGIADETGLNTGVADVDSSGSIDFFDAMYILQYFAGLVETLPVAN